MASVEDLNFVFSSVGESSPTEDPQLGSSFNTDPELESANKNYMKAQILNLTTRLHLDYSRILAETEIYSQVIKAIKVLMFIQNHEIRNSEIKKLVLKTAVTCVDNDINNLNLLFADARTSKTHKSENLVKNFKAFRPNKTKINNLTLLNKFFDEIVSDLKIHKLLVNEIKLILLIQHHKMSTLPLVENSHNLEKCLANFEKFFASNNFVNFTANHLAATTGQLTNSNLNPQNISDYLSNFDVMMNLLLDSKQHGILQEKFISL